MTDFTEVYIVDANVLIDYLKTDISILTIYSKEIGQIYLTEGVKSLQAVRECFFEKLI